MGHLAQGFPFYYTVSGLDFLAGFFPLPAPYIYCFVAINHSTEFLVNRKV